MMMMMMMMMTVFIENQIMADKLGQPRQSELGLMYVCKI